MEGCKRLKLKSIQEIAPDISVQSKPAQVFYYKDEYNPMPIRYTSALDHWGFYNGHINYNGNGMTLTLLPSVNVTSPYLSGLKGEGANREADYEYGSSLGILEKITYPTGGYTTFQYEGHEGYAWNTTSYSAIGGARIKKIIDYSSLNSPALVKEYEYKKADGITSSGHSGIPVRYDENSEYQVFTNCGQNTHTYSVTISSNSIYGLGSVNGSHIGYERVTEYQKDYNTGLALGKTVYTYNINAFSEIDDDIGNGDLKKQEVYNASNKLLISTDNQYQYTYGAVMINRRLLPNSFQSTRTKLCMNGSSYSYYDPASCSSNPPSCTNSMNVPTQYQVSEHHFIYQTKELKKQEIITYDQFSNNYLTATKNFTYGANNHIYPTLTEEFNSTNEKVFTAVKYVADFTNLASGTTGSMEYNLGQMQGRNILSLPVEQLQYRTDISGNNRRYISGKLTDYILGNPSKIYFLESPTPLSNINHSSVISGSVQFDSHYRLAASVLYDNKMNLVQQSKINDVPNTIVWGYNKRYPVAQVTGATTATVNSFFNQAVLDNPSTTDAQMKAELNNIRTGLAGTPAQVTTFTYKPMVGISTQTDPRGRITFYEYDVFNRLVLVRDHENKILKRICYNYSGQAENCVSTNTGCTNFTPDWQTVPNSAYCVTSNNANTGYQTYLQIDVNPCSPTYNTTQPVTVYNITTCPLPTSGCSNCTGEDKKCINGVCETGVLIVISSRRVKVFGEPDENGNIPISWRYYCTYAYCFSDHTTSTPYELITNALCNLNLCQ